MDVGVLSLQVLADQSGNFRIDQFYGFHRNHEDDSNKDPGRSRVTVPRTGRPWSTAQVNCSFAKHHDLIARGVDNSRRHTGRARAFDIKRDSIA